MTALSIRSAYAGSRKGKTIIAKEHYLRMESKLNFAFNFPTENP